MPNKKKKKKEGGKERYKTGSGGQVWTKSLMSDVLEMVLPAKSKEDFYRRCDQAAEQVMRGHRRDHKHRLNGDLIRRLLWGIAVVVNEYGRVNPILETSDGIERKHRSGPLSWTEIWILQKGAKSFEKKVDRQKYKPNYIYYSHVFNRDHEEVAAAWKLYGPAQGRQGFF